MNQIQGVPIEIALLTILAAFGVAFGVLYRALTLITGRRRRKRSLLGQNDGQAEQEEEEEADQGVGGLFILQDFIWHGKRNNQVI